MPLVRRLSNILVSSWSAFVITLLILSCLYSIPADNASAQTCHGDWNITGTSGVKTNYQLGETINGSISFKINNSADCPRCTQQILIGLIDSQDYLVDWKCIFDDIPQVCPYWTTGKVDITLSNPNSPGTYRIVVANENKPSCSDAWLDRYRYPKMIGPYMAIATITVSASKSIKEPTVPTIPPLPTPTKEDTTTGSSGSGTPQNGGAFKTGVSTQVIIVVVALLVLLFISSIIGPKARKGSLRFILVLAVVAFLGYLLWMYAIPAITVWFSKNLSTIIGILLLLGLLGIAGIAIWKNWDKIWRWITELFPPPQTRPKPEPEEEGYIYIARCPSHEEDLYKIGRSKDHPRKRMKDIGGTGVPEEFILIDHWMVADAVLAESLVHKALNQYRINPHREFFKAPLRIIIRIIEEEIKDMILETDR